MEHTDREYELENQLLDVMMNIQDYIIANSLGDFEAVQRNYVELQTRIAHWRDNFQTYLQHPKWDESTDEPIIE